MAIIEFVDRPEVVESRAADAGDAAKKPGLLDRLRGRGRKKSDDAAGAE